MRTRLTTLTLAALLTFGLGALPAIATPGPGTASNPTHAAGKGGPGSGHEPGGSGPGNAGSGDGHGSGGSGADESGSGSPESETGDDHGSGESGDDRGAGGPSDGRSAAGAPSPGQSLAPSHATRPERASAAAPELAPPVGSEADRQGGFARLSTAPSAALAGVVGGALLLAGMVAAGFRARARLGRLG